MPAARFGEFGLLVATSEPIDLWHRLCADPPAGMVDVVAGAESVLLVFDGPVGEVDLPAPAPLARVPRREVEIPVCYDGPDLDDVARATGVADVGRLHSSSAYPVSFVGFSPGFAYLSGLDRRLDVPRLPTPRTSVPAGSVAVAAGLTAVYPQATPGGWRLIGRTDRALFDPRADPPAILQPGDRVRFVSSDSVGTYPSWPPPSLLPGGPHGPRLEVLGVGARLTVQDRGRRGWAHAGVPVGGAADRRSAGFANALVGNSSEKAALEVTLGGCRLRVLAACRVAVTGAPCDLTIDGLPARRGVTLPVPAGTEIIVGPVTAGVHTYLAVSGGIDVEPVLGSRSCDTLSGLGPRPLVAGDVIGVGRESGGPAPAAHPGPVPSLPGRGSSVKVAVRRGPSGAALDSLLATSWEVGPDSDRTGARLAGAPLPDAGPIPSMGMVAGAIQVPPGGQPVVLLRNHPVTGGYPVVAVADDPGVDTISQCGPGTAVRFELVP